MRCRGRHQTMGWEKRKQELESRDMNSGPLDHRRRQNPKIYVRHCCIYNLKEWKFMLGPLLFIIIFISMFVCVHMHEEESLFVDADSDTKPNALRFIKLNWMHDAGQTFSVVDLCFLCITHWKSILNFASSPLSCWLFPAPTKMYIYIPKMSYPFNYHKC